MHSIDYIGGQLKPDLAIYGLGLDLGLVCEFAARFPSHQLVPLGAMVQMIRHARQVGQLKVYLNGYNECVGYVVWALLTPDVENEFISGMVRPLAEWEYNDGTSLWILDMAVWQGSLKYVLEDLRDVLFSKHQQITYRRPKGGHLVCKRVSRLDRTTFMSTGRKRSQI